ncbi:folylpolyglutamate synthase/dihydrofolate synthase family protein [Bacillaceae bacterium S4-13-58]
MTYEEAIQWIHQRLKHGIKPGLARIEWFMEKLGSPEKKIPAVHIAGTNGKGSTVTYMRNILEAEGYRVGTFTSPYIETFNERISVNGVPISDEEWIQLVEVIKPLSEELEATTSLGSPSEFEVITAMMFYYFDTHPVDLVVIETGLGGRLDSTNVTQPLLTIITSIGLDHTEFLGNTYEKIAFEKAGIIKPGIPVIAAGTTTSAATVIEEKAVELKAPYYKVSENLSFLWKESSRNGEYFDVFLPEGKELKNLFISMKGRHQISNATLAVIATVLLREKGYDVSDESIRLGLSKSAWMGRFEKVMDQPEVILDGAHNLEGIQALCQTVEKHYSTYKKHLVFSALGDKPLRQMIEFCDETFDSILFTTFSFPRSIPASDLAKYSQNPQKSINEKWEDAIEGLLRTASKEDLIVVTGSLYFISEVRKYFKG